MKKTKKVVKPMKADRDYSGYYEMPSDGKTRKVWMSADLMSVEGGCVDCMSPGKLKMSCDEFKRMLKNGYFRKVEESKVPARRQMERG